MLCFENDVENFLFVLQLDTLPHSLSASLTTHTKYVRNMQTWHIRSYGVIYQQKSERRLSDIFIKTKRGPREQDKADKTDRCFNAK
jgi:hypothetical protein